jgi:GT2 family glycosyltransferase
MTSKVVTVVLVSYNTKPLLLPLLQRLQPASWLVPVVVDNASHDGSADAVAEQFPSMELLRNTDNVGFARAANQGIARASSPLVVLLNPDTDATPAVLGNLAQFLEEHPDVWAVAPRLIASDGAVQTMAAGFAPTPLRALLYFLGISYVLPWPGAGFSVPPWIARPVDVDWLSGACLTFRREVVDRVGPLDGSFFLYGEDMDWCRRMRAAGGRLVLLGNLDLTHARAASSGHDVVSTDWLVGLARYVRPQASVLGTRLFFLAAAAGFWLRGARFLLPRSRLRRSTLWGYAGAAVRIALERQPPSNPQAAPTK